MVYGDRDLRPDQDDVAPSVIGAEFVAPLNGDEELPATVYLSTERVNKDDKDVTLELRDTADGHRALLAFTSLKQLVAGCGDGQPWVAVQGGQVEEIKSRSGADVVLWDAALPPEERRTRFQQGD
ncbi:SAV_915 family protein [Saccharopolyspora shandongensis]|uniref:SseB protein N-terminal domain-containing protein n=1 Tax=Saccharopolyspora shandongensis TaxID=418495 RepID=A0A1H2V3T4_9PSEU|nr:SAV_915 family protein [Saccharopolyspora shandongensis]SDW62963.1 SseB protein N-terminal domain-containing protein [Saccharopolyspora shandongensis]